MTPPGPQPGAAVVTAMICAGLVTAQFIAGKATRDALFLASLDVTSLPAMVVATSVLSIGLVVASGRCLRRLSPPTFIAAAFVVNAVLLAAEWLLVGVFPRVAATLVYLQISGFGPMLGSGFWLIATERFDPYTAKKRFGQIAGVGTLGGLAGGLVAERMAAVVGVDAMLPVLAALNLVAAWQIKQLGAPITAESARAVEAAPELAADAALNGFRVLKEAPYLRNLAALVLLGTFSAALLDYVFKAQAVQTLGRGDALLRFFAVFYAATSLLTFVLQTSTSRLALEKLGLAVSAGTPSLALFAGGIGMMLGPGFAATTMARGGESVFRGSLYRAGYELFYTPIPVREKRAAKSLIDVGVDRFGDALGGGVVQAILLLAPAAQYNVILLIALACSGVAMVVASRLNAGYVRTLERSLLNRAVELDLSEVEDLTTRTVMLRTLHGGIPTAERPIQQAPTAAAVLEGIDPEIQEILALRSRDRDRIVPVLRNENGIPGSLVPHVIPLLAWDPLSQDAIYALRKVAEEHVGALIDALLDPNQPFAVRRRLARVFSVCVSQRAADGLLLGLDDQRFEVRFHCGRSLAAIVEKNPRIRIDAERVYSVVLREVAVGRSIWASHRLLDHAEDPDQQSFVDEFVKGRTSQGLGHVFTLLALVLPAESLQAAFRALHSDDDNIRGTALEYLDGVLPPTIRERLWPSLEQLQELTRRTGKAESWQAM